jgi:two-component system, OmpR family, copper resistance phosphate regulon response regulator CusR
MSSLLVVEDQMKLLESLTRGLQEEGYVVHQATTGVTGYAIATTAQVDTVVLDLMLPDEDGLTLLRRLRKDGFSKPILIVTARDTVDDRILGLDAGADDYLVKPFSFGELVARLRALFRRSISSSGKLQVQDLELDLVARHAVRAGRELQLTNRQFELLAFLMQHANETVARDVIAREVWKESTATWSNVIDVNITHLRKKIELQGLAPILHTVRGEGYVLGGKP